MAKHNIKKVKIQYTEEMIQEMYKCSQSVKYFANHYCYITHPKQGKIKLTLRNYQERILNDINSNPKCCILACRQIGKTVSVEVYITWYAIFHSDRVCAIMANIDRNAKKILRQIRDIYFSLPEWIRPELIEDNAHSLRFLNGSSIFCNATSPDGLAGESISLLYLDELALVNRNIQEDFWRANNPTVEHGEKIIISSTARGVGDLFHKIYSDALNKRNAFHSIRVDYWEFEGYDSPEWKKMKIKEIGKVAFASEFENKFLGSTTTLIPPEILKNLKNQDPIKTNEIHGGEERYYEKYKEGEIYVGVADIGMGTGQDYSTFQIFRVFVRKPTKEELELYEKFEEDPPELIVNKIRQCYVFRSNLINIPTLTDFVFSKLSEYGEPYLIFENNGIGQSFLDRMNERYYYENCYIHEDSPHFGINASSITKNKMINALKLYSEIECLEIADEDLINEMLTFVEKSTTSGNRRFTAEDGSHDDLIMGLGWCCFLVDTIWFQDMLTYAA